jgi:hypothetical protein
MDKTPLRFVKQVASLAQKLTDAALIQLSDPAGNVVIQRSIGNYRNFYGKLVSSTSLSRAASI